MDEQLANKIDKIIKAWNRNHDHCRNNHTLETYLALNLSEAGYRLDPYPNGKSKPELIAIIEAKQAELDRARWLLDNEHNKLAMIKDSHPHLVDMAISPSECPVCKFLTETSTVKS